MLNRRSPDHHPLATSQQLLRFVSDAEAEGHEAVLIALAGQSQGGPRATGALMAVLDTGDRVGSLSSGCVEAAIVAEALDVLCEGKMRLVRFGEGSDYVDIRLPCGAGMDLLFVPRPNPTGMSNALALLENRKAVTLAIARDGALICCRDDDQLTERERIFAARCTPDLRLIVAGHGAEALALVRQARSFGAIVELFTPDEELVDSAMTDCVPVRVLDHISACPPIDADPWTAVAIMFHDHDWEPVLIEASLRSNAFWIGAMGSSRTAERRRTVLAERGLRPDQIKRVNGPVGTIPSARDPSTLALSVLAEIIAAFPGATA